jgi:hypothetical protein
LLNTQTGKFILIKLRIDIGSSRHFIMDNKKKWENKAVSDKSLSFVEIREILDKMDLNANIGRMRTRLELVSEATYEMVSEAGFSDVRDGRINFDKEVFDRVGAKEVSSLLGRVEADFKEREILILEFRKKFEAANIDNLIERYMRLVFIPRREGKEHKSNLNEYYYFDNYTYSLGGGDLKFLENMDLDSLRAINREFDNFVKNIDREALKKKEQEIEAWESKEKKKNDKQEKEGLASQLADAFYPYYGNKLLFELSDFLGIGLKVGHSSDRKKLKNHFQNLRVDELRKINELYAEIAKKTKSLGGDSFNEEDMLLGFEDLRDGK